MIAMPLSLIAQVEFRDLAQIDTSDVTWWSVLGAAATVVAAFIISRLVRRVVRGSLDRIDGMPPNAISVITASAEAFVLVLGFVIALSILGIDMGPIVTVLLILLIVLAFALRPVVENLAAGLILQTRGPFRVGEQIHVEDHEGDVVEINARATVIETPEGVTVHIPNKTVLTEDVINYTRRGVRRTILTVGLAYSTDLAAAQRLAETTTAEVDGVRREPAPVGFIEKFDSSTINLAIWYWHDPEIKTVWEIRSRVAIAVKRAFDDAGVTIAFPQRTMWWGEGQRPGDGSSPG